MAIHYSLPNRFLSNGCRYYSHACTNESRAPSPPRTERATARDHGVA